MLQNRDDFLLTVENGLALCGIYIPTRESVHVGIFWNWDDEQKIVEFNAGHDIRLRNVSEHSFEKYFFNPLKGFPLSLIDSFIALAELVSQNQLNGFKLEISAPVYNGGKFEVTSGNFIALSGVEKFINCGVFVIALLNTYDYNLIEWSSWPNAPSGLRTYLDDWLNQNGVSLANRDVYYNQSKELRGKHILISPNTPTSPSPYSEVQPLAENLIVFFKTQ